MDFRRQAQVCARLSEDCDDWRLAERFRKMATDLLAKADDFEGLPNARNVSRSAKIWADHATYSAQFLRGRAACGAGLSVIAQRWRLSKAIRSPDHW
jgi:hypothetical protein